MHDDDLITMVKESFTDLHATTPMQQILRRGHAVRTRRRIPVLAGTLAVMVGAVLAVTTLLPGGHQPSTLPAQLAAWTVTRQADGTIRVIIRELRDPAQLQRQLRADGVPASVTLTGQENPACRPYPPTPAGVLSISSELSTSPQSGQVMMFHINPSALPAGTGVQIATNYWPIRGEAALDSAGLVYASPQCTGS